MPLLLIAVITLSTICTAQIKTVKGNYCGSTMGNRAGTFGFRVGSDVMFLEIEFGSPREVRMVRFNVNKLRVGEEFVIKYDDSGDETKFVRTITGTGKRKRTEPCELE